MRNTLLMLAVASIASPVSAQQAPWWPQKATESPAFFASIKPGSITLIPRGAIEVGETDQIVYTFARDGKRIVCTGTIRRDLTTGTQVHWERCGEPYEWFKDKGA